MHTIYFSCRNEFDNQTCHSLNDSIFPDMFDQDCSYSKLLAKQERLVYLHHSARCNDKNCTVTPMCGELQRLWRHLPNCRDPACTVPHCLSSRQVLNHYKDCKYQVGKDYCQICQPLRNIIRREKKDREYQRDRQILRESEHRQRRYHEPREFCVEVTPQRYEQRRNYHNEDDRRRQKQGQKYQVDERQTFEQRRRQEEYHPQKMKHRQNRKHHHERQQSKRSEYREERNYREKW